MVFRARSKPFIRAIPISKPLILEKIMILAEYVYFQSSDITNYAMFQTSGIMPVKNGNFYKAFFNILKNWHWNRP